MKYVPGGIYKKHYKKTFEHFANDIGSPHCAGINMTLQNTVKFKYLIIVPDGRTSQSVLQLKYQVKKNCEHTIEQILQQCKKKHLKTNNNNEIALILHC